VDSLPRRKKGEGLVAFVEQDRTTVLERHLDPSVRQDKHICAVVQVILLEMRQGVFFFLFLQMHQHFLFGDGCLGGRVRRELGRLGLGTRVTTETTGSFLLFGMSLALFVDVVEVAGKRVNQLHLLGFFGGETVGSNEFRSVPSLALAHVTGNVRVILEVATTTRHHQPRLVIEIGTHLPVKQLISQTVLGAVVQILFDKSTQTQTRNLGGSVSGGFLKVRETGKGEGVVAKEKHFRMTRTAELFNLQLQIRVEDKIVKRKRSGTDRTRLLRLGGRGRRGLGARMTRR